MTTSSASGDVLSLRTLNRTLLERQLLLRRVTLPALEAVEHLLGLQGQEQLPPYLALWNRLTDFDPLELSGHIADRSAVRGTLMRGTVHLVSVRDYWSLRALMQPVIDRWLKSSVWGKNLKELDMDAVAAAGRSILETQPRTWKSLGAELQPQWPDRDGQSLAYSMQATANLVHVPPRGLWQGVGQTTLTTAESWLGPPPQQRQSVEEIARRYLRAFGPASVADMQAWSGLTRLKEVFERLRPELRVYRDENGREVFDMVDLTVTDADVPAPARFMPMYDNVLLSHADRSRVVEPDLYRRMITANGYFSTFMVDGFVRGRWQIDREKKERAVLNVLPFKEALTGSDTAALMEEGGRMLELVAPDVTTRDIRFLEPEP